MLDNQWHKKENPRLSILGMGGGGGGNLTTKGDLEVYGSSQTRLGVGADGKVLTANSSATYGKFISHLWKIHQPLAL